MLREHFMPYTHMYEHIYMRAHMQAHTHKHMYVLTHAGKYTDSHNSRQAISVHPIKTVHVPFS